MNPRLVAVHRDRSLCYPARSPYHPPEAYPEFGGAGPLDPTNRVFPAVRESLRLLGLDAGRFGRPDWNPLGQLIRPGETAFLKPNMIAHRHKLRDEWESVITHGSVVRAVLDYVYLALEGKGRIWIGDGPQEDSIWEAILERNGLRGVAQWYREARGFSIELLDLREFQRAERDGIYVGTERLPGDPRGSVEVDLAARSLFQDPACAGRRYYGAYYDSEETNREHSGGRHRYALSRSAIEADVFLNLPKLKTHKKCGLTVNLKSLVGINARKNWLPHYAFGSPSGGGDQFSGAGPRATAENWIVRPAKRLLQMDWPWFKNLARRTKRWGYAVFGPTERVVRSGNWHGNDTVWRMCLDLNRALLYASPAGELRGGLPKRYLSIVDGVVAMEGDGPVSGEARREGLIIAGAGPASVDAVCARIMGFDPERIPVVSRAFDQHPLPLQEGSLEEITVHSDEAVWNGPLAEWALENTLRFRPHFGWVGAIEWEHEGRARVR